MKMYKIYISDTVDGWNTMPTDWMVKEDFERTYETLTKPSMFGTDRFKIEVKERDSFCVKQCACGTCERKNNCIGCDCDICEDFDCQVCFCNIYKEGD